MTVATQNTMNSTTPLVSAGFTQYYATQQGMNVTTRMARRPEATRRRCFIRLNRTDVHEAKTFVALRYTRLTTLLYQTTKLLATDGFLIHQFFQSHKKLLRFDLCLDTAYNQMPVQHCLQSSPMMVNS